MAKDKKGFILYADLIKVVSKLPDETAGKLFKIILSYVNDLDVCIDDLLLEIAFEPIKNQLKRDLIKFEEVKSKRSDAGKRSAELRALKKEEQKPTKPTSVKSVQQSSTNPTVTDTVNETVNDNVNVNVIKKEIYKFTDLRKLPIFKNWLNYRKEIKKPIKTTIALNSLFKRFELESYSKCNQITLASIESNYTGLFWDNYKQTEPVKNAKAKPPTF